MVSSTLISIYLGSPQLGQTIKTNYIKFQTVDPEICSISVFWRRARDWFLHHILCMIFWDKYFSFYLLLTDQMLLSDCLYFLRYWIIIISFPVDDVINFETNLSFLSRFLTWPEKSGQKFKYLKNEKSF